MLNGLSNLKLRKITGTNEMRLNLQLIWSIYGDLYKILYCIFLIVSKIVWIIEQKSKNSQIIFFFNTLDLDQNAVEYTHLQKLTLHFRSFYDF